MEFIKGKEFKDDYIAFGRFYKLSLNYTGGKYLCRSLLEIFLKKDFKNFKDTNKIDAVFIMMNPGGGKPKAGPFDYSSKNVSQIEAGEINDIKVIRASPDRTQYQVMRIMKEMNWKYVRIINLSDYREPKSKKFYSMIKTGNNLDDKFVHSIFSSARTKELDSVFLADKSHREFKVITAWGVDTRLKKLITLALDSKRLDNRIGNNKDIDSFYHYHLLPPNYSKQLLLIKEIINKLK